MAPHRNHSQRQPVRIVDAALATDYQRWQRDEARKSRLLSGFFLLLLGVAALVLIALLVSASRPRAAHGQAPEPQPTAVSSAPEEKCPDVGAFCPRGFLPIAIASGPMKLADAILPVTAPQREAIPDALRTEYVVAYDAAAKAGTVPVEWGIVADDTPATLRTKINALNILAAKADDAPPALPEQSAPVTTHAPPVAPDAAPTLTEAAQKIKARIAGSAARNSRASTPRQDGETVRALEAVVGSKALRQRVTQVLFGEPEFSRLDARKRFALWDWLRPASSADGKTVSPTNSAAAGEVAELLRVAQAVEEEEAVPA